MSVELKTYRFLQDPVVRSRYRFDGGFFEDIGDFPAKYQKTYGRYIILRKKPKNWPFTHCIMLGGGRMITGLNFGNHHPPDTPRRICGNYVDEGDRAETVSRRSVGDYGGHAVLVEMCVHNWESTRKVQEGYGIPLTTISITIEAKGGEA
jgi:hypothetical protein